MRITDHGHYTVRESQPQTLCHAWTTYPQQSSRRTAHWFQPMSGVGDGNIIVQAFYGQGTRFLDLRDPRHPVQVGYFVPTGSEAATPAFHDGLVYAAQSSGRIDVLRFTPPRG